MSIWADAGAALDAVFADPELLIYTGAGLTNSSISAIRLDDQAPDFSGPGNTLRTITYEVAQADLPQQPDKSNTFTHRGRTWKVSNRTRRDDIGKWWLIVEDIGPAT